MHWIAAVGLRVYRQQAAAVGRLIDHVRSAAVRWQVVVARRWLVGRGPMSTVAMAE